MSLILSFKRDSAHANVKNLGLHCMFPDTENVFLVVLQISFQQIKCNYCFGQNDSSLKQQIRPEFFY